MEPNERNLYFIDDDTQYISLARTLYTDYVKTIMKPDPSVANRTNMKQLTLDLEQK